MNADWITAPGDEHRPNLYFRARRKVHFGRVPEAQSLRIAAESFYKLWINGIAIGEGPARGSRSLNFYDTWDLAPWLREGENWISVLVYSMNKPNYISFPVAAAVAVELEGVPGDWETLPAEEWREDAPALCPQIVFSEWRDLRLEPVGWQTGADNATWSPARILAPARESFHGKRLLPRPVAPLVKKPVPLALVTAAALIRPAAELPSDPAQSMTDAAHAPDESLRARCQRLALAGNHRVELPHGTGDISLTLDFGRTVIGFLEIDLAAAEGVVIDIGYDEALVDGRVVSAREYYHMADRFTTRRGRQTIGSGIHERGFRYVELVFRNLKTPLALHRITAVDRRYPWPTTGSFHCSDHRLDRIWEVCLETLSTCTTDVFNDCPWRERAFWVNDLLVENVVTLTAFGDARMNAHALRLALSNRREDGVVPGVCPDTGDPRLVLAATNALLPMILKDYLLYTGDRSLAAELLPVMEEVLDVMETWRTDGGLLAPPQYWNFIDWSYHLLGVKLEGKRTSPLDWIYALGRQSAAWLSKELGQGGATRHEALARETAASIPTRYWREKEKRFVDWEGDAAWDPKHSSQLTHALGLLSGLLPDGKQAPSRDALVDETLRIPELYLHHFVFQAMSENGMGASALARIRQYWGGMVDQGAQTLWEYGVYPEGLKTRTKAASNCHGFGATPVAFFHASILGVRPLTPGFTEFTFDPEPHDLAFAEGRIPTPQGPIQVSWKRQGDVLHAEIQIPQACTAVTAAGRFSTGHHHFELPRRKS
jgi:hypothetical protein